MALDIWVILVVLLAPVLAEYAKLRAKAPLAFNMIFGAGVLFLLAVGFGVLGSVYALAATYGALVFEVIGWILLLIGSLWAAFSLATDKGK